MTLLNRKYILIEIKLVIYESRNQITMNKKVVHLNYMQAGNV